MADEPSLEANVDNQEVVEATEAAPSEGLTTDKVQAMIAEAREQAIKEAEDRAFRKAQSKIDQDIARTQQTWQSQYQSLQQRYEKALAEQGVEPETLEQLHRQTQTDLEMQELRRKAQAYEELRSQTEAEREREQFITEQCRKYNVSPYDERLNKSDPYAFSDSILAIREERLARQAKDQERKDKQQGLERLAQAGALDVTGGGAAMAPPAWSTDKLVPGSEESIISDHVIHYFGNLSVADLGQKILKVQQLMKNEPLLAGKLQEAARRVYDMES